MKVYLLTSNKYTLKICPINIYFLNKYWPNLDVTIVGYEDVLKLEDLPPNVDVVCVGNQSNFGNSWSDGLIPFFKGIPEEYFTLIFDDHILMNEVSEDRIEIIEEQFRLKNADKAMIGGGLLLSKSTPLNDDLLLFHQGIMYRTSLHPAIWTKEYFLKYLKPGMTSWDFELKNPESMHDGAKIINLNYDGPDDRIRRGQRPEERHIYSYLELYTKGTLNIDGHGNVLTFQPSSCFFDKEKLKYIWDEIHKGQET